MAVPTFERFLRPTLDSLSDGHAMSIHDVRDLVGWHFDLSEEDRAVMTRGGSNTQLHDRVTWAMTYLFQSGLVERPRRAHYRITDRGREALAKVSPEKEITREFLDQYPEYRAFKERRGDRALSDEVPSARRKQQAKAEPESALEALEHQYEVYLSEFVDQLADTLGAVEPRILRELLARVLAAAGLGVSAYQLEQLITVARDGSLEAEFWNDALRRSRVYVKATIGGEPATSTSVQEFLRVLSARRVKSGVLVSLAGFTDDARRALELTEREVSLLDARDLADVMIKLEIGVLTQRHLAVYQVDSLLTEQ